MTMTAALWLIRLATLNAVVKVAGRSAANTMTSAIRPATAGSAPTSPPRTFWPYARAAARSDCAPGVVENPDCGSADCGSVTVLMTAFLRRCRSLVPRPCSGGA